MAQRTEFLSGRAAIVAFLKRKWAKELEYRLKKTLWGFRENRIAVSFEYEWHNPSGQWFRSYGNELWEFDDAGLMRRRLASINDAEILQSERRVLQGCTGERVREMLRSRRGSPPPQGTRATRGHLLAQGMSARAERLRGRALLRDAA